MMDMWIVIKIDTLTYETNEWKISVENRVNIVDMVCKVRFCYLKLIKLIS